MAAANNPRYLGYPFLVDAQDLMRRSFDYLKTKMPAWQPSEGQLDTMIIEAVASEAADIGTLTSQVTTAIYRDFGNSLMGIPPIDATAAVTDTTFNLIDTLGHTINAGTQVGIRNSDGDLVPFQVLTTVIVPGGEDTATVTIVASIPGANGSTLGSVDGPVELIDVIEWIDTITQDTVTIGGVDAELDGDYLTRLTQELQTITPTPILPRDFSILATKIAGVRRATTIDLYNPDDDSDDNPKMVTVVALDSAGNSVGSTIKTEISEYLESLREINFVVKTMEADINDIDVDVTVTTVPGYNSGDVAARVFLAIANYLSPASWGAEDNDNAIPPKTWTNKTTIEYLELASVVNNVIGVNSVTLLKLAAHGDTTLAEDFEMDGVATLPSISTITNIAVSIA